MRIGCISLATESKIPLTPATADTVADARRLKLSDMISLSRPHGGFALLFACQMAMGDKKLSDEAIHIAAGILFAGYGGVVTTSDVFD